MMKKISTAMTCEELIAMAKAEGLKVKDFNVRKWADVEKDSLIESLRAIQKKQAQEAEQAKRKAEEAEQKQAEEQARKQAEEQAKQEAEKANRRKQEQERRKQAEEAEKKEQAQKKQEAEQTQEAKERKQAEKQEQAQPKLADFVRDDKGTCLWYIPSLVIDRDKDRNIRGHAIRPKKVNMPIPRKVKKQAEEGFIVNVLYRACEITESRIMAQIEAYKKQAEETEKQTTAEEQAELVVLQTIYEAYHAKVTAEMLRLSEQVTEKGEKLTELFAHWLTGEKLPVNMASVYECLAGNDGLLSAMDKFNVEGITAGSATYDEDTRILIQEFREAIKRKLSPYTTGNDVHFDIPLGVSSLDVLMFYKWSESGTNGKTRNRRYAGKSGAERFAVDVLNWLVFKVCKVKMTEAEKAEDLQA